MQEYERLEDEQIEYDSQSEDNTLDDDNNVDRLSQSSQASMEDISDSESDELDEDVYLRMALTEWACRGVSKRKVNSLLNLLRKIHPELPKTYVTLLNTPKITTISEIDNGHI